MIFRALGQFVRRAWAFLLVGWALLLAGTWYAAPPWDQVAQDQEFAFLPANSPSRKAEEEYAKAFPNNRTASNVVLVLHRADNEQAHLQGDLNFISDTLEPDIRKIAEAEGGLAYEIEPSKAKGPFDEGEMAPPQPPHPRSIIAAIRTPNTLGIGSLLVSPDRHALLVEVELTTPFVSHRSWPVIDNIQDLVRTLREQGKVPEGLDIALTGSAVLGRDHSVASYQSVRATGFLTVVLVIGLLIVIYRAPLLALIPLATVYLSVQIAIHVLAILAQAGHLLLFQGIQIYITILAYGAGVDYCLFLTARYKEELDRGADPADAVAGAVGGVGAALTASAATVICGIAMMTFAEFGKFRQAGIAIPLSLFLVMAATLTFSPALLRLAGRWAFWPHRAGPAAAESRAGGGLQRIWDRVGQVLLRRAGWVWLATVALMAPFAVLAGLFYNHVSYDMIGDLPASASSAAGTRLLQEHFPAGILGPVTVLLIDRDADFGTLPGAALIGRLTDRLRHEQAELGLADVRSLTRPLGTTEAAEPDFYKDFLPKSLRDLPPEDLRKRLMEKARDYYLTDLGEQELARSPRKVGTRLDLVLTPSPFARQSIDNLGRIEGAVRDALPDGMRGHTQLYFIGSTASVRDLGTVMQRDRNRIEALVLAGVFLILVVLLRRLVVPLYLLLSVLFSYYTTLGVSFVVFWLLDPHGFAGIDWKVTIFLFTILVAVGEDYNIFLMTRVHEEERRHGPLRGITEALDRTGPIISSCGIIMAGTFASLLGASLTDMKQLGFALAFGVLLDTFVVRPILVPAFLVLLNGDRFRPARWVGKGPHVEAGTSLPHRETAPS